MILSGTPQVEFLKQLPSSSTPQIQTVELEDLPVRPDRTTRLRITASPVANDKIEVEIRDLGFGEFSRLPAGHGKYHNDGINVWVNYYFVMKQLRLCPII